MYRHRGCPSKLKNPVRLEFQLHPNNTSVDPPVNTFLGTAMVQVSQPSSRVTAASFQKPPSFDALEAELIALRKAGEYSGADRIQKRLEVLKQEVDARHLQV